MFVAAGRFRTCGSIERIKSNASTDATGRADLSDGDNWETVWEGRMEVIAITARERIYAQQPVHDVTHRITIRKSCAGDSVRSADRVCIGDRVLNISGIVDVGNPPRVTELSCVEVTQ